METFTLKAFGMNDTLLLSFLSYFVVDEGKPESLPPFHNWDVCECLLVETKMKFTALGTGSIPSTSNFFFVVLIAQNILPKALGGSSRNF